MKKLLFFFSLIAVYNCAVAQLYSKRPLAISDIKELKTVRSTGKISPYGHYVAYIIDNEPVGNSTLVLQDTAGKRKMKYTGVSNYFFSDDEKQFCYLPGDSTLHIVELGTEAPDKLVPLHSIRQPAVQQGAWLAYQTRGNGGNVVLLNLLTNSEKHFDHVLEYAFDQKGKSFLTKTKISGNEELWLTNLFDNQNKLIWEGQKSETAGNITLSHDGAKMAFTVGNESQGIDIGAIWMYTDKKDKAIRKMTIDDSRLKGGKIMGGLKFSADDRWLYFSGKPKVTVPIEDRYLKVKGVNVWNYRDTVLQPHQFVDQLTKFNSFTGIVSAEENYFQLFDFDHTYLQTGPDLLSGNFVVVGCRDYHSTPIPRGNFEFRYCGYLVSLIDGSRSLLTLDSGPESVSFSPDGKWLVYWDTRLKNYFSFDLKTRQKRNLTNKVPVSFTNDHLNALRSDAVTDMVGWVKDGPGLLVYSNNDLWEIDPHGKRPPKSITANYGRLHHIKLRLIGNERRFLRGDTLLFVTFNDRTKENGFFKQILGKDSMPKKLFMGREYVYVTGAQTSDAGRSLSFSMKPVKAAKVNSYLVMRQTASDAPNYYISNNLKSFSRITNIQPQKNYNWLTSEVISWQGINGVLLQGVLYKPEDFDPKKKYPVIIHFYQQFSDRAFQFPKPNLSEANINIPWFVSHGYLVFTPDIHLETGLPAGKSIGEWAYNSIVPVVKKLSRLPYVNDDRIAIQGHSFGGNEVNYLVAHTDCFAAAESFAGPSDGVSNYLSLAPDGEFGAHVEKMNIAEVGQLRYGVTLWQRPDLYIKDSPVLNADQVSTPLLIVSNKEDSSVPFLQGQEYYMALRRLSKPTWMLQYDDEGHILVDEKNALDHTIRLQQFFDHLLKGYPPPVWMTKGIPAKLKGIDNGYAMDFQGSCSDKCPICKKKDYRQYYIDKPLGLAPF